FGVYEDPRPFHGLPGGSVSDDEFDFQVGPSDPANHLNAIVCPQQEENCAEEQPKVTVSRHDNLRTASLTNAASWLLGFFSLLRRRLGGQPLLALVLLQFLAQVL